MSTCGQAAAEFVVEPRRGLEDHQPVGGAEEQPQLFAAELRAAFKPLR
ncbi:MAG: hypothetical protein ACRDLY_03640 [Thermoleophilaceae bacterium]